MDMVKDKAAAIVNPDAVAKVIHKLKNQGARLETFINATPTSPRREQLTDVNIHVQSAIAALENLPPL